MNFENSMKPNCLFLMIKICDRYYHGVRPYKLKILLSIYTIFTLSGLALLLTYDFPYLRYGIIIMAIVVCIIKHNLIINMYKMLVSMRRGDSSK